MARVRPECQVSPLHKTTASVPLGSAPEPGVGSVLSSALASGLLFSALLLPNVIPEAGALLALVALVSPFPLILVRLRGNALGSAIAAILASVLVAAVFSAQQALLYLAALAAPGLLFGEAMARGRGILHACGWGFGLLAAQITLALLVAGPEMAELVAAPLQDFRSAEFLEQLRAGGMAPEGVERWSTSIEQLLAAWQVVYPAAFLVMGALLVLGNGALVAGYVARRHPGWLETGEFEALRWPLGLSVVFVAAGAAVLVPPLEAIAYNVLLFVAFVFALQGLAVVLYYAHRLSGPPLLRVGLVVFVLLNPWAPQILALLGLFDIWFDFRKWADPPEAKEE